MIAAPKVTGGLERVGYSKLAKDLIRFRIFREK